MGNSLRKSKIWSTRQRSNKDKSKPGPRNNKAPQETRGGSPKPCGDATTCATDNHTSPGKATELDSDTCAPVIPVTDRSEAVTYDVPWDRPNNNVDVASDGIVSLFDGVPEVTKADRQTVNEDSIAGIIHGQEKEIYDEPWEAVTSGHAGAYGKERTQPSEVASKGRVVTQAISFQPNNVFNHGRQRIRKKRVDSENLVASQTCADDHSPSAISAALRKRYGLGVNRVMQTYADPYVTPSAPPTNENAFHLTVLDESPRQDISFESATSDKDLSSESPENYGSIFYLSMDSPMKNSTATDSAADPVIPGNDPDKSAISIPKGKNLRSSLDFDTNGDAYSFEKEKWYHGRINRQQAEERMEVAQKNGAFLVRRTGSENSREYALTVRAGGDIMHMKIERDPFNRWVIGAYSLPFLSVSDMIEFYSVQKLPIQGVRHVRLSFPVTH